MVDEKEKEVFGFDVENQTQMKCLEAVNDGHSVFITGVGGSGKSYFTKRLYNYSIAKDVKTVIMTTTGIAATNFTNEGIPAGTIHSYMKLGVNSVDKGFNQEDIEFWKDVKRIIIDEVSMWNAFDVDRVHHRLKYIDGLFNLFSDSNGLKTVMPQWGAAEMKEHSKKLFGGKQIILVGDMSQLPPVVKTAAAKVSNETFVELTRADFNMMQYDSIYWFDAHCFSNGNYKSLKLFNFTKNYRQGTDLQYAECINRVRLGDHSADDLSWLNQRWINHNPKKTWSDDQINKALIKGKVVFLASTNKAVYARNTKCIDLLKSENPDFDGVELTKSELSAELDKREAWVGKYVKLFHKRKWEARVIESIHEDKVMLNGKDELVLLTKDNLLFRGGVAWGFATEKWKEDKCDYATSTYLDLLPGMKVMTLKNKPADGYMNGTITFIHSLHFDSKGNVKKIFILNSSDEAVEIEKHVWATMTLNEAVAFQRWIDTKDKIVVDGKEVTGLDQKTINAWIKNNVERYFEQFPIKVAFALSFHKSQGLTFADGAFVEPYAWENGQLYVALSRVTEFAKLHLAKKILPSFIKTDEVISQFYKDLS